MENETQQGWWAIGKWKQQAKEQNCTVEVPVKIYVIKAEEKEQDDNRQ